MGHAINATDRKALALVDQARGALNRAEELLREDAVSRPVVSKAHSEAIRALSAIRVEQDVYL